MSGTRQRADPLERKGLLRLGSNVHWERTRRRWSQDVLAHRASLSREWVGAIERGEGAPSPLGLVALAGAFEISVDELLDGIAYTPPRRGTGGLMIEAPPRIRG